MPTSTTFRSKRRHDERKRLADPQNFREFEPRGHDLDVSAQAHSLLGSFDHLSGSCNSGSRVATTVAMAGLPFRSG